MTDSASDHNFDPSLLLNRIKDGYCLGEHDIHTLLKFVDLAANSPDQAVFLLEAAKNLNMSAETREALGKAAQAAARLDSILGLRSSDEAIACKRRKVVEGCYAVRATIPAQIARERAREQLTEAFTNEACKAIDDFGKHVIEMLAPLVEAVAAQKGRATQDVMEYLMIPFRQRDKQLQGWLRDAAKDLYYRFEKYAAGIELLPPAEPSPEEETPAAA